MSVKALLKKLDTHPYLRAVEAAALGGRAPVYVVGGALRDAFLGRVPIADLDLAIEGPAKPFAEALSARVRGSCFPLHEATQIYRITIKAGRGKRACQIDVARVQGRSIEDDLARRDFTINAMALPLPAGENALLDPFAGSGDLKRRVLRMTRPGVFDEDPLRLLRAFRIASQLGFSIDERTFRAIHSRRKLIIGSSPERRRAELMALLAENSTAIWLQRLDEARLLTMLFPELETSRRCAEVYYGRGGVLKHTLTAVARMDFLLANLPKIYPGLAAPLEKILDTQSGGARAHRALLRLAVLLHDIAKPATARRIGGRLRFFTHEERGAQTAAKVLRKLRFSRDEIALVSTATRHHLRPGNLAANKVISERAVFRFFRDLGSHGIDLLLLAWADHSSYLGLPALRKVLEYVAKPPHSAASRRPRSPGVRKTLHHLQVISFLLDRYFNRPDTVRPKRLLNGRDIMKALRLPEGPEIGRILRSLEEAQAEGRVKTRAQALRFIQSL